MEQQISHKRSSGSGGSGFNLMQRLAILLRTHKEHKYLCMSTSIAYRVAGLCDLAINRYVETRAGRVAVVKAHSNPILNDFLMKITQVDGTPAQVIRSLNGERKKVDSIRHLRKRIYKEIDSTSIVSRNRGVLSNKIVLKDTEIWRVIFDELVQECVDGRVSPGNQVILLCLEYINNMHDISVQLPREKNEAVVQRMSEARSLFLGGSDLVSMFVRYMSNKG